MLGLLNFRSILFLKNIVQQMQSDRHNPIHKRSFRPLEIEKNAPPTLATIPLRSWPQENEQSPNNGNHISRLEESEKVIPGYNFQSLFRKKSHIRLARKKNRLQAAKKNSNAKVESCEKQSKNTQKGHWNAEENKLYHWFLEIHNRHFIFKHLRRTDKIFKSMASFIKTRQAQQCRSHHQKMQKKYHTFYQILLKLRGEFYNTASPDQLRFQLQQNGYRLKDASIISELELKNGDIAQRNPEQDPPSFDSPPHSLQEQDQLSKHENNLLAENYEHELHLKLNY